MTASHSRSRPPSLRPVALACALLASTSWAQTPPTPADGQTIAQASSTLKPVVISGSRSERELEDVPARIDVIEGEALDPTRAQDIRELVRELPNVEVKRAPQRFGGVQGSTGRDGNSGFNIRGLQGNRVLLTVDGIRMPRELNNGVFGSAAFGRDYYDLGLISRVEILRGSASALYGSDGLAGMVAMYTTQPKDLIKDGKTFGGRAGVRADSEDNSVGTGVTLAGIASEQLQWLGSVQLGRAEALDNMGENTSLNSNRTAPNPQKDKSVSALGKIILTPGGGQTHTFTIEHVDKDTEVEGYTGRSPSPATGVQDLDGTADMQRTRLSWDGRFQIGSAWADSLRATAGHQQSESREWTREQRVAPAPTLRERDVSYEESLWQAVLQAERTRSLGSGWANTLVYGVDVSVAELDNLVTGIGAPAGDTYPLQRFPTTRETTTALFVQSEFVSDRWSFIPALRYDRFSLDPKPSPLYPLQPADLSDSALSPKLGVIFRPQPNWQLFANAAAGFKAPSPLQLNNFFQNPIANYRTDPNPNLKPETSQTLELGARGEHGRLNWLVTAFTGRYKDFIEDNVRVGGTGAPGDPIVFQSINRNRVKLSGLEVEGRWSVTPATAIKLGYGHTKGRDTLLNQPLNSVNPAKLVFGVDHRIRDWTLGAVVTHARAKDSEDIDRTTTPLQYATPSWTTLDLRAVWRVTPSTRLSAAIHNVTDRKYWQWSSVQGVASNLATLDGYTAPGRSLSLALVTDF